MSAGVVHLVVTSTGLRSTGGSRSRMDPGSALPLMVALGLGRLCGQDPVRCHYLEHRVKHLKSSPDSKVVQAVASPPSHSFIRRHPRWWSARRRYAVAPIQYRGDAMRHVGPRDASWVPLSIPTWRLNLDGLLKNTEFHVTQLTGAPFMVSHRLVPQPVRARNRQGAPPSWLRSDRQGQCHHPL
jgi:hypothetical protein